MDITLSAFISSDLGDTAVLTNIINNDEHMRSAERQLLWDS